VEWLAYVVALLFMIVGAACILLVVIQLPGTWIMLAIAGLIEWADRLYLPDEHQPTFGWPVLLTCLGLAVIGEIIEFVAGVAGARRGGSTARGMWGALIGGIAGVFLFAPLFVVTGPFGPLFGAILGTFVGALVGELSAERATVGSSMRPAIGATLGRVVGTMSKIGIAMAMWLALTIAAFWP